MNGLRLALSFLTTLPILSAGYEYEARHWRATVLWFPIVGGLIGGLVWLTGLGAARLWSGWLAAVLAAMVWAAVTGGLHLDGLADCCDGLLASVAPERRLEIMHDPRVGAFGAIGLILFLLFKVGALQMVLASERGIAIPFAAALGRVLILWVSRQQSARPGGLGATFAEQVRPLSLAVASLLPVIGLILLGWRGVAALGLAVLLTIAIIVFARRRIGGVTGDVNGLTVELVELTVLLVMAAQIGGG
jgi:adenosylcobinamide-GDP ribazoletransferase